jgi:RNA polymerase sigma-70 factor (ECF subfamily)
LRDHTAPVEQHDDELVNLLLRYKSQIFGFIFCMVQNLADAEDVFQQAAITMWTKFDELDREVPFLAWALNIARFKALSFLKSRSRDCGGLSFSEDLINQLAAREVSRTELQESRLQALRSCRAKLSESDQTLLAMCYGGADTIREAAKRLGRPDGSVYDSLSRIRRALFDCIQRTLAN